MYCPKCRIPIEHNGAQTCPYCSTPLTKRPAPLSTTPVGLENRLQADGTTRAGTHGAHSASPYPAGEKQFFSLENILGDTDATDSDAPSQTDTAPHDLQNSMSFGHKQTAEAYVSDQDITHDSIFEQLLDANIHDASTGETPTFQASDINSGRHQSQSRELLDTAFKKIEPDDQYARALGSKSLIITALLGALVLLSVIGTGLYYLNHTALHETAQHGPAKILTLPSSKAPAPTLKNAPVVQQQSQEGATYTAQDGSQPGQNILANQTPAPEADRFTSDRPEARDIQSTPTKQAPTAGADEPQQNIPSSGEGLSVTGTSQAPIAGVHTPPRESKNESSGTNPIIQNGRVVSSANSSANTEIGSHILLCGSFQSRDKALKLAAKIKSKGYMPFVEKADLGSKGIWYRLKIAGFSTKEAAEKVRGELNAKLKVAAIVVKNK
ncbi:MAG: SPOR domain-containing protein [Deltaproteobacteria bacterium]|nr:SPOR domain-containing protein [Deltaproteobacteria bacterium]